MDKELGSRERDLYLKQMLNLIGLIVMLTANFLANWLPINNITTAEVSDLYPNIFTPAGITFAIWGLIYLVLSILTIYLFWGLSNSRSRVEEYIESLGPLFFISSLLNTAWIFAWHYLLIELSVIIMIALLASLIIIYRRIKVKRDFGWLATPFSIYLGWISVATIANIVAWQTTITWDMLGLTEEIWLAIILLVILALTVFFLKYFRDLAFSLVVLWALAGIFLERSAEAAVFSLPPLATAIVLVLIILAILKFYDFRRISFKN